MAHESGARAGRGQPHGAIAGAFERRALSLRFILPAIVAMLVATAAGTQLVAGQTPPPPAPGSDAALVYPGVANIFISPGASNLFIGGPAQVLEETVAGVPFDPGLGSFQLNISFDPNTVQMTIDAGPFLGSTGRATACSITAVTETVVLYNCASSGAQQGAYGSGVLARLTLTPAAGLTLKPTTNNGRLAFIDNLRGGTHLYDKENTLIPINQLLDAVVAVRALEGDLNGDCTIDILDEQLISTHYNAFLGSLLYVFGFDVEPSPGGDFDIDIKDLQFIFGRDGDNCKTPQPTPITTGTPIIPTVAIETRTPTPTGTSAATNTPTVTNTATSTATAPVGATRTPLGTNTPALTGTATPTKTAVPTATSTGTPVATQSPQGTRTVIAATQSPQGTHTVIAATQSPQGTRTAIGTGTPQTTATRVGTTTSVPTATATRTGTPQATATSSTGDGCSPGFWKEHTEVWGPSGYAPNDSFESVFGRDVFSNDPSLLDVLNKGGGGVNALSRQAVAALLNASHPLGGYPMTADAVIQAYEAAIDSGDPLVIESQKNVFDAFNNGRCRLNEFTETTGAEGSSVLGSTAVARRTPVIANGRSVPQNPRPGGLPPTGGGELPGGDWTWALTLGSLLAGSIVVVGLRHTFLRNDRR